MLFDRKRFFDAIRPLFGGSLQQQQVEGLEALLAGWEKERPAGDRRWLAYLLATAFHETNRQMQPVREAYWLSEAWRRVHLAYYPYYGRGYVQLTHRENYRRAGTAVGRDLEAKPDAALEPATAFTVMLAGMEEGWFRGDAGGGRFTLGRFFSRNTEDPVGARQIVNGAEWVSEKGERVLLATRLADYHRAFLHALAGSAIAPEATVSIAGQLWQALLAGLVRILGRFSGGRRSATE